METDKSDKRTNAPQMNEENMEHHTRKQTQERAHSNVNTLKNVIEMVLVPLPVLCGVISVFSRKTQGGTLCLTLGEALCSCAKSQEQSFARA